MADIARRGRESRVRRHVRIRKKMAGTPERPRLCVFRSLKHIYAQIIDDTSHKTLVSAGRVPKVEKGKLSQSKLVGAKIAELALARGITQVVFDRGGYQYHGRVKALAEAARQAGLKF
ncbi:MAG: 50S ribosomal protein L18 [Candidatus Edwardsbacteria bacterium]|nr:50S ribosomal protein L18 [Candidatus Edwardsbacteria bacterium]